MNKVNSYFRYRNRWQINVACNRKLQTVFFSTHKNMCVVKMAHYLGIIRFLLMILKKVLTKAAFI